MNTYIEALIKRSSSESVPDVNTTGELALLPYVNITSKKYSVCRLPLRDPSFRGFQQISFMTKWHDGQWCL